MWGKSLSPVMSDRTILVSLEDLINMAMGPADKNKVNYKLVQTVLHILATQLRMLEQRVEITITEQPPVMAREITPKSPREQEFSTTDSSLKKSPRQGRKKSKVEASRMQIENAEHAALKDLERGAKVARKEQDRSSRVVLMELEKEAELAEKEKERESRAPSKDREKAVKEKLKEDWAAITEKEKEASSVEKERQKEESAILKEKETSEKVSRKERAKTDELLPEKGEKTANRETEKDVAKDKEKDGKAGAKDKKTSAQEKEKVDKYGAKEQNAKERMDKEHGKVTADGKKRGEKDKGKSKRESDGSITVTEVERGKQKILVVEKGPNTRADARNRGNIEVVTQSEFDMLKAMVQELAQKAGPLPTPALPDNKKLRLDLAKGTASLTDTMEAMQVNARIQAAERAISRMSDLLTQLATGGPLPEDFAGKINEVRQEMELAETKEEIDEIATKSQMARHSMVSVIKRPSVTSRVSDASGMSVAKVTHPEMDAVIQNLREELKQNMYEITTRAGAAADSAAMKAKYVAEKMDIAVQLDARVSKLHSQMTDYTEQLGGLEVGLSTQMQGFQEQMEQMRSELKQGLTQLEMVNTNSETTAVMELTERYEGLVSELDQTLHTHGELTIMQKQLDGELHSLLESVEMLHEQKADRDEVLDGLRDKADLSHLEGLLTEQAFAAARSELERRLEACHDKFHKQDDVWMNVVKDLTDIMAGKAELIKLMSLRDEAQQLFNDLNSRCTLLAQALGDPKAAMTTRLVSLDAKCGVCTAPALMDPEDAVFGQPPPLPALPPRAPAPALDAGEPCLPDWRVPAALDDRSHACHRWVGGSHTLLSAVKRRRAAPIDDVAVPTNKYTGYGDDGRLYMMEEKLLPCVECNTLPAADEGFKGGPLPSEDGAGDRAKEILPPELERKVTMVVAEKRLTTV